MHRIRTAIDWLNARPAVLRTAAMLLVAWLVLSHAWMTDDAYFSFRSVDNFINGHGLTWNVTERVQGFTHPLWVLLLSAFYFFTHEIYLTSIMVSLGLTMALAWLVLTRFSTNIWHGLAALSLLCLSTAFIDYSTSGLENPLTHLLLGIFLWLFLRQAKSPHRLQQLALVAGLMALNRLDTILLCAPALAYEWWHSQNKVHATGQLVLGFLPLALWELFSVVYYGFPFPNTFYAKALNYVGAAEEVWAGLNYYYFTLRFDPITWVVIVAGLAAAVKQRQARPLLVATGMLLYLVYILQIGGDFMGGRFLSAVFLAGTLLLLVDLFPILNRQQASLAFGAALALSLLASSPPFFLYAKGYETARWEGVVDERMVYAQTNFLRIDSLREFNTNPEHELLNKAAYLWRSVVRGTGFRLEPENDWIRLGESIREQANETDGILFLPQGANGFTGYYAGPKVYFIHGLALTDGLLARVPPIYNPNWRSGHFMRLQPDGYLEVEAGTQPALPDPELNGYYQKIRLVTHGPLFTRERWLAIWELNTRVFIDWLPNHLSFFRFPALESVLLPADAQGEHILDMHFSGQGSAAQVNFAGPQHHTSLQVSVSGGDNFALYFLGQWETELASVRLRSEQASGVEVHDVEVPLHIAKDGYLSIRLVPVRVFNTPADGVYSLFRLTIPAQ